MGASDPTNGTGGEAMPPEQELLRRALRAGGVGTWRLDPTLQRSLWDEACGRLLGFPRDLPLSRLEEHLPAADADELRLAIAETLESGGELELDVRVRHDGSQRWVRLRARPEELGGRRLLLGTASDRSADRAFLEALRAESHRKDDFLGMLGHELRNPIGALASGIRLLQKGGRDEQELEWIRSMLAEQVAQTSRLLEEVLDASRIVRRKIALRRQPVAVAGLVERAHARAREGIERRQHALEVDLRAGDATASLDGPRVEQALVHLLSNAARFTPTGGKVRLATRLEAGLLVLEVADTGIGFDPELALRVFEPASPAPPEGERTGLGLGLLFVREIVDLHGGRVELESGGRGAGGSTVRLVLPTGAEGGEEAAPRHVPGEPRVLVVDDHRESAQIASVALEEAGCRVETAFDAAEALHLALAHRPDVVVLDLVLPDLDGFTLAAELRARESGSARIVATSGFAHPHARRRVEAAGLEGPLLKPIDAAEVVAAVARAHR